MIQDKIFLDARYPNATLTLMLHDEDTATRPAVIVCPGGAYFMIADREGAPVAEFYYQNGMNAYVLNYSVAPEATDFRPLIEAALAVKYVREHAAEHHIDPKKIITCGFSAGGHLAASAGILWNIAPVRAALGITDGKVPEGINRPDGIILCYAVTTTGEYGNVFSVQNLTGKKEYTAAESDIFSLELQLDKSAPPAFIWHTATDDGVSVRNATLMAEAYLEQGLPFEAHIYPRGPHGMALATEATFAGKPEFIDPHVATWAPLSLMWIEDMFGKE